MGVQSTSIRNSTRVSLLQAGVLALAAWLASGCGGAPAARPLPPSASDLPLLTSTKLCDSKATMLAVQPPPASRHRWGAGEEIRLSVSRGESVAEESYFFTEDGVLVAYLLAFPEGLRLKPYPVLRDTLSLLEPTVEFYLSLARVPSADAPESSALYMTGDERTTTQYLVQGPVDSGRLLLATMSIDPYFQLFSPYRRDILARLRAGDAAERPDVAPRAGAQGQNPFRSLQLFARGEMALLGYCGPRNEVLAADAYEKAIARGFTDQRLLAEAHHKLGLAWKARGELERAREELEGSLSIVPNRPEVLNNLGDVYHALGRRTDAMQTLTKAVALRPNYPIARYNLAKAYESIDVRRAVEEYETYLAVAEDMPEEAERVNHARQRLNALTH